MKHIYRTSILLSAYLVVAVVFNSCCPGINYYRLTGDVYMQAYKTPEEGNYDWTPIDTVRSTFHITAQFEREFLEYANYEWEAFPKVYATSCEEAVVNPLDAESLIFSIDKSFYFDTIKVDPNTPIQNFTGLHKSVSPDYIAFYFQEEFMDKAVFDTGQYVFTIQVMNFDSIPETFATDISLYMDIQ